MKKDIRQYIRDGFKFGEMIIDCQRKHGDGVVVQQYMVFGIAEYIPDIFPAQALDYFLIRHIHRIVPVGKFLMFAERRSKG